jgi:serine protease Do
VEIAQLDAQTRRQYSVPTEVKGVVITEVEPGSAAERARLEVGDVIEDINRQPAENLREAIAQLRKQKEGSTLMRVWSNGGSHYVLLENNSSQPRTRPGSGR